MNLPFDASDLRQAIKDGYVTKRKHPVADLFIYNYTPKAQFDRVWNNVTINCRGLILDGAGELVARPFKKFFNYEEHENPDLPPLIFDQPYYVLDKLDGSLGILYHDGNGWAVATRGSFESDQAIRATEIYRRKYADFVPDLTLTYLFEIIYPENRIVVDYGKFEDLVLLDVLVTATGKRTKMPAGPFPVVEVYPPLPIDQLTKKNRNNKEGFVLLFKDGTRVKVKHAEYVRLHRILTQISSKSIWALLRAGLKLDDILDRVPDEFYQWVKRTRDELLMRHDVLISDARVIAGELTDLPRKEVAARIKALDQPYPAMIFCYLDGKDDHASEIAWKHIRPKYERPFTNDIDN